eukprot:14754241-Alexandrium_andersonii.AAC.1
MDGSGVFQECDACAIDVEKQTADILGLCMQDADLEAEDREMREMCVQTPDPPCLLYTSPSPRD